MSEVNVTQSENLNTTQVDQVDKLSGDAPTPVVRSKLSSLKMVFSYMLNYKAILFGAAAALLLAVAATLTLFRSLEFLIDAGFGADDATDIAPYFMFGFVLIFVLAIATGIRFSLITRLGERVVADIRITVHEHLLSLSPVFFEDNRPSEIASRLTADTTLIQTVVGSSLSVALRSGLNVIGALILILLLNPKLILTIFGIVLITVVPIIFFGRKVRKLSRSSQDKIADVGSLANEAFGAIQVVQAFTREEQQKARFSNAVESAYDVAKKRIKARAWMMVLVILLIFGFINFGLWRGAEAVIAGNLSGGQLATFMGLAGLLASSIAALVEVFSELQRAAGAADRITELLNTESDLPIAHNPIPLPQPCQGVVKFDRVSFAYPSKPNTLALDNFSLDLPANKTIALVGPSGAGKSTCLQMLLRFFDPQQGNISVDGLNIRDLDPKSLRAQISLVPQETIIFADTIKANVLFGRPDASDAELKAALDAALCTDFVDALPEGINTHLGERGIRLSGGQRQRIAIARAVLRSAPILLLDEATSALDSESEQKVQQALDFLMQNRTTLVIAHRLATVRKADQIVVLDQGKIVAQGKHDELIESDGLYARLAKLQFTSNEN